MRRGCKDCKSCRGITWLYATHEQDILNILSWRESIPVIRGLSTTALIHQTFTAYFHSGLLLLRLLLKAIPQSAGVNILYINEKCKCYSIKFLNMLVSSLICWVSRRVLSWDVLSCHARWPNGLQSCNWSTDIVSSSPFLTSVSKKLPIRDTLELIHFPWLGCCLFIPPPDEQLLQQWPVELGNKCPRLKIIILSSSYQQPPCIDWAPRHVKECHCLSPIRALSHCVSIAG